MNLTELQYNRANYNNIMKVIELLEDTYIYEDINKSINRKVEASYKCLLSASDQLHNELLKNENKLVKIAFK